MRYIDSGTRNEDQAVAHWLQNELKGSITEMRVQSGFFSRDAVRPFLPRLAAMQEAGSLLRFVIGSNDGGTVVSHVRELVGALGLPRDRSSLGVVYLSGAYFHPKTIHLRRDDGSQLAYVGSANFTLPGIAARHVEAGLLLDSAAGDSEEILNEIAQAVDNWFQEDRPGFEAITNIEDVERLWSEGIFSLARPPSAPRPKGTEGQTPIRPKQTYLVHLQQPQQKEVGGTEIAPADEAADDLDLAIVQHTPPYPPYMYFAPSAEGATFGKEALTGFTLGDAVGLIVRLSRDNDRHWRGADGTANLSVPISAASSIRFGFYGNANRPRAEFPFLLRYLDDEIELRREQVSTGLMSYGYTEGDNGHADLRLVLPRPAIAPVKTELMARGVRLPQAGDLAILEWPTSADAAFRMTFTNPNSALGTAITAFWEAEKEDKRMASRGACWLPAGLSPNW